MAANGAVVVHSLLLRGDGEGLTFSHDVRVPVELGDLPRLGVRFALTPGFEKLTWFGPGPHETYADRKTAEVRQWSSTVTDQYVPYLRPQDHGHHTDTRWFRLSGPLGTVEVRSIAPATFSFAARHHSDEALEAATTTAELDPQAETWVHVDHLLRGVGTGSCGPDTLAQYRIGPGRYRWSWRLTVVPR